MTTNETGDPILRLLAGLPLAAPSPEVDRRVRSRCYAALAARHTKPAHRTRSAVIAASIMNAALAIAAGIYAAAAGYEALRLAGIF